MRLCSPRVCNPRVCGLGAGHSIRSTTPSSAIARGSCWSWRPASAVTPRSRTRSATSSTASAEPSPLGPLRRERGVARGAGDRPQPRPLDGAARARRGNRDDQDAQAALLRSRRTAHPLGPALDPAPPEALALGRPVGSRPGATTGRYRSRPDARSQRRPAPRLAPACPRTPRAPSRRRPQRPRAVLSDGSSLRHRPANAATPAERSASPASRPVKLRSWIRASGEATWTTSPSTPRPSPRTESVCWRRRWRAPSSPR